MYTIFVIVELCLLDSVIIGIVIISATSFTINNLNTKIFIDASFLLI